MSHRTPTLRRLDAARAKARQEAERAVIRDRYADYEPTNVRTYGEPWDSRIAAAADSAVPLPASPNRGRRG